MLSRYSKYPFIGKILCSSVESISKASRLPGGPESASQREFQRRTLRPQWATYTRIEVDGMFLSLSVGTGDDCTNVRQLFHRFSPSTPQGVLHFLFWNLHQWQFDDTTASKLINFCFGEIRCPRILAATLPSQLVFLGVDCSSFVLFNHRSLFPLGFNDGFLERFRPKWGSVPRKRPLESGVVSLFYF